MAEVSSSMRSVRAPSSRDSMMEAACEVEPDAFSVEKDVVSAPPGRWVMNGEMSTPVTARPSAARTFVAVGSVATSSRPSPGMCA